MSKLPRRRFLQGSALAGGTLFGIQGLMARGAMAAPAARAMVAQRGTGGYGPLSPRRPENYSQIAAFIEAQSDFKADAGALLALPEGFKYTAFGIVAAPMSNGTPTPPAHDGMAAYAAADGVRLVRNHEVRGGGIAIGTPAYDPLSGGGTTTLVVDPATRLLTRDWVSLAGTSTNCAGGLTPWGAWLTCEETVEEASGVKHGYNFEVPAGANAPVAPVPLTAMGRFVHEAIAIDPRSGIVYETEDRGTAGFYRFLPARPGKLAAGGRLQMLAVKNRPNYDTRTGQRTTESCR